MTLRPVDYYNAWMNDESASYPWGSWYTYEDMQIAALCAAIAVCGHVDDHGHRYINTDDLQELISQLEAQSNKLKENKQWLIMTWPRPHNILQILLS